MFEGSWNAWCIDILSLSLSLSLALHIDIWRHIIYLCVYPDHPNLQMAHDAMVSKIFVTQMFNQFSVNPERIWN